MEALEKGIISSKLLKISDSIGEPLEKGIISSNLLKGEVNEPKKSDSVDDFIIIRGDRGGYYVIFEKKRDELPQDYKTCYKNKNGESNDGIIGEGSFGKIYFAICLVKPGFSPFLGSDIFVGELNCVKQILIGNPDPKSTLINEKIQAFCYHSSSQLVGKFFVPIYDSCFRLNRKKKYVGYTIQKFILNSKLSKIIDDEYHCFRYSLNLFNGIKYLLKNKILLSDFKAENILYNPFLEQLFFIDLDGRIMLTSNEIDLVKLKFFTPIFYPNFLGNPNVKKTLENLYLEGLERIMNQLYGSKKDFFKKKETNNPESFDIIMKEFKKIENVYKQKIKILENLKIILSAMCKILFTTEFEEFKESFLQILFLDKNILKIYENVKTNIQKNWIKERKASNYQVEISNPNPIREFDKIYDDFLKNDSLKLLVLLGDAGTGKSTVLQLKFLEYLSTMIENKELNQLKIPFFMYFGKRQFSLKFRWEVLLNFLIENKLITKNQDVKFQTILLMDIPFIGFLDAFDEGGIDFNFVRLFIDETGHNKQNKFILSSRISYLESNGSFIFLVSYRKDQELILKLEPFEEKQLQEVMLEKYNFFKRHNLLKYAQNGFLLKIMNEIFEKDFDVPKVYFQFGRMDIMEFYSKCIISQKLQNKSNEKYKNALKLVVINGKEVHKLGILLGKKLYFKKGNELQETEFYEVLKELFEKQMLEEEEPHHKTVCNFFQEVLPDIILKKKNISIFFYHELLKNFYIVKSVEEDMKDIKRENITEEAVKLLVNQCILSMNYVDNYPELVHMFSEQIQSKNGLCKKLKAIVKTSKEILSKVKDQNKLMILISNIITLLIAAHVHLCNLDNFIKIQHANLRDAIFHDCELEIMNQL